MTPLRFTTITFPGLFLILWVASSPLPADQSRAGEIMAATSEPPAGQGRTYYVRHTTGNDANDGLSPDTAWRHVRQLGSALRAGDTAYVGPGLYRDQILLQQDGTAEKRIRLIADPTGQHTGDPPGPVVISGAEPVDEERFKAGPVNGVYQATFPVFEVLGVVEMDGNQHRYLRVTQTEDYLVNAEPAPTIVAKLSSSFWYDNEHKILYLQTSDGRHPREHEIELFRRINGVYLRDRHYITISGFTFRHMGDAGINFFKGSSHGVAMNNVCFGSRQGIRVYGASNIVVYGNTLFRNENSGVYFAARSLNGLVLNNVMYENRKGVRWGSASDGGVAMDNALFDHQECGISMEHVANALLRRNRLVNNTISQLLVIDSRYSSENNCFESRGPEQLIADFHPFVARTQYRSLVDYQQAQRQDLHSTKTGCGPLPEKVNVHALHAESTAYRENARTKLATSPQTER